MTTLEALDRVLAYLADEQEDYDGRPPGERAGHIWEAVQVLARFRQELREGRPEGLTPPPHYP